MNLVNAKENRFDGKKVVGKLKKIERLQNKEDRLKNHCEILSEKVKDCNNVLPLAQKIVAMNIDIKELLLFDTAVNEIAKLKKELDKLLTQVFAVKQLYFSQNKAMMAMLNLRSRGITEDQILQLNNLLENNGYKDINSNS